MTTAIVALLSVLVGLVLAGVVGIWLSVSQLADLKAYTITAIDYLQQMIKPREAHELEKVLVKHTSDGVVISHPVHARARWLIEWPDANRLHEQLGKVLVAAGITMRLP
jgi:hypothetical protein